MAAPSDLLSDAKKILDERRAKYDVTPKLRARLQAVSDRLGALVIAVKEIEELIVLDPDAANAPRIRAARGLWMKMAAGTQPGGLEAFVRTSPLLGALFREGFNFTQLRKFSDAEIAFAKQVGDRYAAYSAGLRELRRAKTAGNKNGPVRWVLKCTVDNGAWLAFLVQQNIIKLETLVLLEPGGTQTAIRPAAMADKDSDRDVVATYTVNNAARYGLLGGEWLNAYVYNIVNDHLLRNCDAFELYTDVSYQTPSDVARMAGEFDIVGLFGNKLLCIECKSGNLDTRATLRPLAEKTKLLRDAMSTVQRTALEPHFYLVFDAVLNVEADVARKLKGTGIKPLRPDQVRKEVQTALL
ncbi:MAG TPA: DUF1887 family CARF protein [Rhizomicrobium sp.]|jgi:hypothetical protein